VRSAMDWAQARTMAAEGRSQREIARTLGINRRTAKRLIEADEPPSYRREPGGSMLDPLGPVIAKALEECPEIKAPRMTEILRDHGYAGSVDLVKRRLRELRPRAERPAQRTGYRPAQVMQLDWAEMPTRPKIAGKERRVYAVLASLPFSGAQTAHFSFEMTQESFLEGHVRAFEWLGGVPRECVYDNLRSVVARREGSEVRWAERFTHLRGHYAFHATACTPATPREKGSVEAAVRYLQTGFWPLRRFADLAELEGQYAEWRDDVANARIHATGRFPVAERLELERDRARALPPERFDFAYRRTSRVPLDGYLRFRGSHYRAPDSLAQERVDLHADRDWVWITHRGITVAHYARSYRPGSWIPAPVMRAEPPPAPRPAEIAAPTVAPPALADYAELAG
jgi:transposase